MSLQAEIKRIAPLAFSQYQELVLYHPEHGFYSQAETAGRDGDFITSPELGTLFATILVNALSSWWKELGRPDPFFVVEAGAGRGTLASTIVNSESDFPELDFPESDFYHALRYVLVERSAVLRQQQKKRLSIAKTELVLSAETAKGPLIASVSELPDGLETGIVFANELFDNLPIDIYEYGPTGWFQCWVTGDLKEIMLPVSEGQSLNALEKLGKEVSIQEGQRIPLQREAQLWLKRALNVFKSGKVASFDYCHSTKWMAEHGWENWLRTYRGHFPGLNPYQSPGTQDITCDVAHDQLQWVQETSVNCSQAEFLRKYGLDVVVSNARDLWGTQAATGGLVALKAMSLISEADALTALDGLGAYRFMQWDI